MLVEDIKKYCMSKHKAYEDFPDEELLNMIDHAYETVFCSFSKKVQKQLSEEEVL